MPERLRAAYLALRDEDLTSLEEQIRLLAAREAELVERVAAGEGESAGAWLEVRKLLQQMARGDLELEVGLAAIADVVDGAAAREHTWRELERLALTLRRLKEAQRRKLDADHAMLSLDHVIHLVGTLGQLALQCIALGPEQGRQRFEEGIRKLEGRPIQEVNGVEVHERAD